MGIFASYSFEIFQKTSKDFPATTVKHGEWGGLKLWIDSLPKIRALRNNSAPGTYVSISK